MVITLGALLADVPHTRAGAHHRHRHRRRAHRPAGPRPVPVRGPDRDRRGPERLLPRRRGALGVAVGAGAALPRRAPEPAGDARRSSSVSPRLTGLTVRPDAPAADRGGMAREGRRGRRGRRRRPQLRLDPRGALRRPGAAAGDITDQSWGTNLPTGDELAREVERFLREQRDDTLSSRVQARVDIAAPVDEVFAFFDDLANAAVLVPSLDEITTVEPLPAGGRRVEYTTRGPRRDRARGEQRAPGL